MILKTALVLAAMTAISCSGETEDKTEVSSADAGLKAIEMPDTANLEVGAASVEAKIGTNASGVLNLESPLRVNVGGFGFTDGNGNEWLHDRYFSEDIRSSVYITFDPINGTENDRLYQSERFFKSLGYAIPVDNGRYSVKMHFAEIYFDQANKRVFSALVEDELVFKDFDLIAAHGEKSAVTIEKIVDVLDGQLNMDLWASQNNAKLAGYEVTKISDLQEPVTEIIAERKPMRINAGGGAFLTEEGYFFSADKHFVDSETQPSKAYANPVKIAGADDPILYSTERFAKELSYAIPAENGRYEVKLHMAEIWTVREGVRVYDVAMESNAVLTELDLLKVTGAKGAAKVYSFDVEVSDGELNIDMVASNW